MRVTLPPSLQQYSPAQISKTYAGVRTVKDALSVGAKSLKSIARTEGCCQEDIETLIKIHLVALDVFLKQKNGLTRDEIDLVAEEVMRQYGHFITFADIHVIFRNAKLGRYGELYNQLTCAKVMGWFDSYVDERMNTAEEMSREADRKRYCDHPEPLSLDQLGYTINKDGRIIVDEDFVNVQKEAKEREEKRKRDEAKAKIDKDNDYRRWKANYIKNGTL